MIKANHENVFFIVTLLPLVSFLQAYLFPALRDVTSYDCFFKTYYDEIIDLGDVAYYAMVIATLISISINIIFKTKLKYNSIIVVFFLFTITLTIL